MFWDGSCRVGETEGCYLGEHVWGGLHLDDVGRSRTEQLQAPH